MKHYNGYKPNRVPYKKTVPTWARKTEVAPDAATVAALRVSNAPLTFTPPSRSAAPKAASFGSQLAALSAEYARVLQQACDNIDALRYAGGVNSVARGWDLAADLERVRAKYPIGSHVRAKIGVYGEDEREGAVKAVYRRPDADNRVAIAFGAGFNGAWWAYPENVTSVCAPQEGLESPAALRLAQAPAPEPVKLCEPWTFVPGMKVRCLRPCAGLERGRDYTVERTERDSGGALYLVLHESTAFGGWRADRFEPVSERPAFVEGERVRGRGAVSGTMYEGAFLHYSNDGSEVAVRLPNGQTYYVLTDSLERV